MANRISVVIDVVADKATQSFGKLKQSISDADGAANKFKAGAAGAFESVKQNAGNLALAAGTALVAFGVQAVSAFQETALAAGELRDKLGLTAEEASRFVEVAGDMGINVADLESTIGRMNREAANSPGRFDAIGAAIVRNKDGTINTKNTFLSVVDALNQMPDAAQRAKAGQEIFGRSWMNIAEMVGEGAEGMQKALDSVETNKVIDDAEIQEARRYRDAMDALKGVAEDLTIVVGSHVVPVIADLAEGLQIVIEKGQQLGGIIPTQITKPVGMLADQVQRSLMPWKYYTDFFGRAAETTATLGDLTGDLTDTLGNNTDATDENAEAKAALAESATAARERVEELTASMLSATGQVHDLEQAEIGLQDSVDQLAEKYLTALGVVNDATASDREKAAAVRDTRSAQIDAAAQALALAEAYAAEKGAADGTVESGRLQVEKLREMQAKYPELRDDIQLYIDKLLAVPGVVDTTISADTRAANASLDELLVKLAAIGSGATARAAVSANRFRQSHTGSRFEAGEAKAIIPGQQLFVPDGPGRMYSPAESQRMLGGGAPTVNVTVMLDGQELRGMVRTEIVDRDAATVAGIVAGVR